MVTHDPLTYGLLPCTEDASEVTCPACIEALALRVERELEQEDLESHLERLKHDIRATANANLPVKVIVDTATPEQIEELRRTLRAIASGDDPPDPDQAA